MSRRSRTYKAILHEVARGSERSTLFWWLVENHDAIEAQAEGKRISWEPLCERFVAHGLTDVRGQPPTSLTARKTWLRARRAVAEARERKRVADASARPGQKYPSRISPDWRPQVVPAAPTQALVRSGVVSSPAQLRPGSGVIGPTVPPVPLDAPFEFATVDAEGNPVPEGKVFYEGKLRSLHAAQQLETMHRRDAS